MNGVAKSAVLGAMGVFACFTWRQSTALDAAGPSGSDAGPLETIIVSAEKRDERLQQPRTVGVTLSAKF
jgi:hypothetical protein